MRPKKFVLLADTDADRLACMAFVLDSWGFAVVRATDAWELGYLARWPKLDGVVIRGAMPGMSQAALEEIDRPVLMVARQSERTEGLEPDVFVDEAVGMAVVRERLRVLCVRKRGPRKAGLSALDEKAVSAARSAMGMRRVA